MAGVIGTLNHGMVVVLLMVILIASCVAALIAVRLGALRRVWARLSLAGTALAAGALLLVVLPADGATTSGRPRVPGNFYGISPQAHRPQSEYNRMKKIGVDAVRFQIGWSTVEPSRGNYDFSSVDSMVRQIAKARLQAFPFVAATPSFYGRDFRTMPVQTAEQRNAWQDLLRALVRRYGPGGRFWNANPGLPKRLIRIWQIWNEENFDFFTSPRSPKGYATLVKISSRAINGVDPKAKVILGGLFMHPKPSLGIQGTTFLRKLYGVRGIKAHFDGVAMHPYAKRAGALKPDITAFRRIMAGHGDRRTGLYLTEFGWGSGHDTAFEKGIKGQVRELTNSFTLLRNRQRSARIRQIFWFAWDDLAGSCDFCDSAGIVRQNGDPKPAYFRYRAFAKNRR